MSNALSLARAEADRIPGKLEKDGLALCRKDPKRYRSAAQRILRDLAKKPNECWPTNFMPDQLCCGRRFRVLTSVDNFSRESLAIKLGQRLTAHDVVVILRRLSLQRPLPESVRVDNDREFTSLFLDLCAYTNGAKVDFSRPGEPRHLSSPRLVAR